MHEPDNFIKFDGPEIDKHCGTGRILSPSGRVDFHVVPNFPTHAKAPTHHVYSHVTGIKHRIGGIWLGKKQDGNDKRLIYFNDIKLGANMAQLEGAKYALLLWKQK